MMKAASQVFVVTWIAAIVVAGQLAAAQQAAPPSAAASGITENDYTRSVARPYNEVLAAVKQAAEAEGFRVSNVHDIAATLRKAGIEHQPYATVEVCDPKLAARVLKAEPRLGSVMPCRIAVYQQGQRIYVSMLLPSRMMALFPANPEVTAAATQVERSMKAIIDRATR